MASNIVLSTEEFNVVGTRPIRHDGTDKVTGLAQYSADIQLPGLLHGKVLDQDDRSELVNRVSSTAYHSRLKALTSPFKNFSDTPLTW